LFVLLGGLTLLVISGKLPASSISTPSSAGIRIWFLSNALGFCGCGILGQRPRAVVAEEGIELEEKREELLDLQDFTEDIIHSMRGGLLTTDVDGGITLLNRTGKRSLQALCRSSRAQTARLE